MSRKDNYEERAWELLKSAAVPLGITPVDAEFVKEGREYYLRFYIDREEGITIDDCETVSKILDPMLDEEDFIEEAYTLEVSSPGLGRALKRPRDFEFAKGKEVEIGTFKPIGGKKEFRGILTSFDASTVTVDLDGTETVFEKNALSRIRLSFDV